MEPYGWRLSPAPASPGEADGTWPLPNCLGHFNRKIETRFKRFLTELWPKPPASHSRDGVVPAPAARLPSCLPLRLSPRSGGSEGNECGRSRVLGGVFLILCLNSIPLNLLLGSLRSGFGVDIPIYSKSVEMISAVFWIADKANIKAQAQLVEW